MFPSSNVTAPNPLGELSERTNLLPVTRGGALQRDRVDTRDAARKVQELPGRIHLKRPDREVKRQSLGFLRSVGDAVARIEYGRIRHARGERVDREIEILGAPRHLWHRQRFRIRRHRSLRIVPGDELAVDVEKWLDRELPAPHLDHSLFVDQRLGAVAIDADHGPVRLLAQERPRIAPLGASLAIVMKKSFSLAAHSSGLMLMSRMP